MNTIPHHHRWPAEGSAQQHWQEKVVEGQIFGVGAGHVSFFSISMLVSRKMCVYAVNACRSQPKWEQWSRAT